MAKRVRPSLLLLGDQPRRLAQDEETESQTGEAEIEERGAMMIISKCKYEERIKAAVEKEMQQHMLQNQHREIRREIYGEFERMQARMNLLERRNEELDFRKKKVYGPVVDE